MRITALVLAAVVATTFAPTTSSALDPRFKDADGDLLADVPSEAKDQIDPSTLVFAYTHVEDPSVYAKVWEGFLKHMEAKTGKKVQFFPVQSNAAQIEAMRAGRLHVAGFNTGSNPLAVACAWVRDRPGVASAIIGARDAAQLLGGLAAEDVTLPAEIRRALDDVSGPGR